MSLLIGMPSVRGQLPCVYVGSRQEGTTRLYRMFAQSPHWPGVLCHQGFDLYNMNTPHTSIHCFSSLCTVVLVSSTPSHTKAVLSVQACACQRGLKGVQPFARCVLHQC